MQGAEPDSNDHDLGTEKAVSTVTLSRLEDDSSASESSGSDTLTHTHRVGC